MPTLTGPLAETLKRGRDRFNARFTIARAMAGGIDAPAFLDHLARMVDPIIREVHATAAEKTNTVTEALYDLSLALFGAALLGPHAKTSAVSEVWQRLLPKVPRLLALDPQRVAGSLSNAVHNLTMTPGARPELWTHAMAALAGHCQSVPALLDCGKVVAWRAGMAQYREGALTAAGALDPGLAAQALGVAPVTTAAAIDLALKRMAANPWLAAADALADSARMQSLRQVGKTGAFRGFGGAFLRPPLAANVNGKLLVSDAESIWLLLADVYGSVLQRVAAGPLPKGQDQSEFTIRPDGTVRWGDASARFEELSASTSAACDGSTAVVTLPASHHIFLLGRR